MNERQRQILERLSKDKPEPIDLETLRQGYGWGVDRLIADLTELERDHRIDVVGLNRERIGGNDRLIGEVKITFWGEELLADLN
jgi:hypothetical protein